MFLVIFFVGVCPGMSDFFILSLSFLSWLEIACRALSCHFPVGLYIYIYIYYSNFIDPF